MTTIAEFGFDAESFPLGILFERFPAAEIELERLVPTTDAAFPYFWIRDADPDSVVPAVGDHEAIAGLSLVGSAGDEGLFRAEWNVDAPGIVQGVAETGITVLSATATAAGWTFEFRAADSAIVTRLQRYCADQDIDFRLKRLYTLSESGSAAERGLTEPQREALLLAYERGYFDEPRQVTLESLAADLGITRQSLSGRLRRGHRRLIADTIAEGG